MATTRTDDEREPLLPQVSQDRTIDPEPQSRWLSSITIPSKLNIPNSTLVPVLGMLTVFLNESEFYFKAAATVRAIEAMSCYEYYSRLDDPLASHGKKIPEVLCKIPSIQKRVATLFGAAYAIRMICAVTGTAFIVSFFSSGTRRPILIAHKVNLLFTQALTLIGYLGYPKVPIWLICLNGVFALVGGNFDLGVSTVFASYADVISDPARRSTLIFVTSSLQYASQAICLPITSRLINLDGQGTTPEVALWTSSGCAISVFLITFLLYPETSSSGRTQSTKQNVADSNSKTDSSATTTTQAAGMTAQVTSPPNRPLQVLKQDFGLVKMGFLLLSMLCSVAESRLVDWYGLMQYPSVKFQWTLSKTTIFVTGIALLSFLTFTILLPQFTKLCTTTLSLTPRTSSMTLVCVSASILLVSCILMGLPTTTIGVFIGAGALYPFGSGINSAIHAYTVNVAADPRASGVALTVLSLGATGGKVLASILWPVLLRVGLEMGAGRGRWSGLPFLVAGGLAVVSAGAIVAAEWVERRSRGKMREVGGVVA